MTDIAGGVGLPAAGPLTVNGSPTADQLKGLIRQALAMAAGMGLLARFLPPAAVAWVQTSDGLATLSAIATAAVAVWAWMEKAMAKAQLVLAAKAHPTTVTVK